MTAFPYFVGIGPASQAAPDFQLTIFESWTLNRNLDDGCSFSFVSPGDTLEGQSISELDTDVWLYRNGLLEQRFRILEVEQRWDADGRDDIAVTAVCYRRLMASRHVVSALSYSSTSQGTIVWNLVSHTQAQTNGSLGLTLGSSGPALLRDRAYDVGQNILEAITDLSKIENGIVWDVNENLDVIVTTADAFPIRSQPVVLGVNVDGMTRPSGAALFGNVALVSGDAVSTSIQITAAPTLGTDPRGRWERYVGIPSEKDQTALVEAADGLLEESQSPSVVWSLSVIPDRYFSESDFALGDFVTIVPPISLVAPLTPSTPVEAQIVTQEITVSPDGEVQVVMSAIETTHPELASIDTDAVTSVTPFTAQLNGDLTDIGSGVLFDQGFVYSTSPNPIIGGVGVTQVALGALGVGTFSDGITGLTVNTTYYVKAYAITTVGVAYAAQVSFLTGPFVVLDDPVYGRLNAGNLLA